MSNFPDALQRYLESLQVLGLWEQHLLWICRTRDAPRHARVLARLEDRVREHQGIGGAIIDWFKENWVTILQFVLAILPFLLMLAAQEPGMSATAGAEWFPGHDILLKFLPEILDAYVMPSLDLMVKDWQTRLQGLPVSLGYDEQACKQYILNKFKESNQ